MTAAPGGVRPAAIVVDLWETLVPLPREAKDGAFLATAAALGVAPTVLREPWTRTRPQRETGDLVTYLGDLARTLGLTWSPEDIAAAVAARRAHHGAGFRTPHNDGLRMLAGLRRRGVPVAVVSNCSSDVAEMLAGSPLAELIDAPILSARSGVMKPDPAVYRLAAAALDVAPERCVYVGDGLDDELGGAVRAGMHAILVDRGTPVAWDGPRIVSLAELLTLQWDAPSH